MHPWEAVAPDEIMLLTRDLTYGPLKRQPSVRIIPHSVVSRPSNLQG